MSNTQMGIFLNPTFVWSDENVYRLKRSNTFVVAEQWLQGQGVDEEGML